MGYFQVRYDSRVGIYDCRAFIRLTTGLLVTVKTRVQEVVGSNPSTVYMDIYTII